MAGLNDITPVALTILLSGVILIFVIYVLNDISETDLATTCVTTSENMTLINNTAVSTTYDDFCNVPSVICNSTVLAGTEYDYDSPDGSITLQNNTWNGTGCLVGYKYEDDTTTIQENINEVKLALNDFTTWFALIILVIVAAIIMSLLFKGFSGNSSLR